MGQRAHALSRQAITLAVPRLKPPRHCQRIESGRSPETDLCGAPNLEDKNLHGVRGIRPATSPAFVAEPADLDDDRLDRLLADTADGLKHDGMDRKLYFRELFRLQGELVKLQDWVF